MVTGFCGVSSLDQGRRWLGCCVVDSVVFDRGSHPDGGVTSLPVVEDLEVFEDGVGQLNAVRLRRRPGRVMDQIVRGRSVGGLGRVSDQGGAEEAPWVESRPGGHGAVTTA